MAKEFPLADIISAGFDVLVSERGIGAVYDVLDFMTGEKLYTHQLPRVGKEAQAALLKQHPELGQLLHEVKKVTRDNWKLWLDTWIQRYGSILSIEPMTAAEHNPQDPISELKEMMPQSDIIVIKK